jgi:hypothetical protein
MNAAIDHLVYGSPDLAAAIDRIAELTGVRAAYGGQHRDHGTHNALLSLGDRTYLEIIAPDPDQPRPRGLRPFGLDDPAASGLRAWAAAPGNIDAAVQESLAQGFDYGLVVPGQRHTADGRELSWRMTTSPDGADDGAVPFLIDWAESPHPAHDAPGGLTLAELRLASPAPKLLNARLRVLGIDLPVDAAPQPGLYAVLAGPRGERVVLGS